MSEIQLVIFDCDGVLIDSEIVAAAAELEVYKPYGLEMDAAEFSARMAGLTSADVKLRVEEELEMPLPDKVIEETKANVDEKVIHEAKMIDGADTVLDLLDQARCVCSNSPSERLERVLGRLGLYDRFRPYVFSAYQLDPPMPKPKPDLHLKAISEFEVEASKTVIIEDSVTGVQAGVAAGCRVIGFTGASHSFAGHADQLVEAGAETVVSRLTDVPAVVEAFAHWDGV